MRNCKPLIYTSILIERDVKCTYGYRMLKDLFAGFSILTFLSFVQWALTTASRNSFKFISQTVVGTQQIYRQMQLRYLSTVLKAFSHVYSNWFLMLIIFRLFLAEEQQSRFGHMLLRVVSTFLFRERKCILSCFLLSA